MITETRQARCPLVDVVIHVPEIVCLAPRLDARSTMSPRVHMSQAGLVPPLNPTHATRFTHPNTVEPGL